MIPWDFGIIRAIKELLGISIFPSMPPEDMKKSPYIIFELKDILIKLGLASAFSNSADFSGMINNKDLKLKIDNVIHKTFIDVSEKQTEAAAATAIMMTKATAAAPRPVPKAEFHADRPFVYFIIDDNSKAILFMGMQNFN